MHTKNISLAVLVDGKSLYENKNKIYIPYGTNYEIFAKNNNNYDVYITISRSSLVNSDTFLIKAKSKRTIKGFSENGLFYGFRFVEYISEMKDKNFDFIYKNQFKIEIQKKNPEFDSTKILEKSLISPLLTQPQIMLNEPREFFSERKIDLNDLNDLNNVNYNNISLTFDQNSNDKEDSVFVGSHYGDPMDAVQSTFTNETSGTNAITQKDLDNIANAQKNGELKMPESFGTHVYGKPVDEKTDLDHPFNLEKLDSIIFEFEGLDENGNKLTKPLFAKDNVVCQICEKKASPSNTYCSNCGSYIIKTANLIDDEVKKEIVNKKCCNKTYPSDYKYCPICSEEF